MLLILLYCFEIIKNSWLAAAVIDMAAVADQMTALALTKKKENRKEMWFKVWIYFKH